MLLPKEKMVDIRDLLSRPSSINWQLINVYLFFARIHKAIQGYYIRQTSLLREEKKTDELTIGCNKPNRWDWKGIANLSRLSEWQQRISTVWLIFCLIKCTLPVLLTKPIELLFGSKLRLPAQCYLLGRFVVGVNAGSEVAGAGLSSSLLAWRFFQHHLMRPYVLSSVMFMLHTDRDISKFHKLMKKIEQGKREPHCGEAPDGHYEYLRDQIMCYKVIKKGSIFYRLRPNRTLEAKQDLNKLLVTFSMLCITSTSLVALIFVAQFSATVLSDKFYLDRYPGCSPGHQFDGTWSTTFTWHRCIALVFDMVENMIVWGDGAGALLASLSLDLLINFDLLVYWHYLDNKLRATFQQVLEHREQFGTRDKLLHRSSIALTPVEYHSYLLSTGKLNESILELQAELVDLFAEYKRADMFASDINTASVGVWLQSVAVMGTMAINNYLIHHRVSSQTILFALIQLGSFIILTFATSYMLRMQQNCLKSYTIICSLMAYDQSPYRLNFRRLIDLYTVKQRHHYTILQHIPYSRAKFLSIVVWSMSIFLVCDKIFRSGG